MNLHPSVTNSPKLSLIYIVKRSLLLRASRKDGTPRVSFSVSSGLFKVSSQKLGDLYYLRTIESHTGDLEVFDILTIGNYHQTKTALLEIKLEPRPPAEMPIPKVFNRP
jgi:hypothetical protein